MNWAIVQEFPDYEVSDDGAIRRIDTGRIRKLNLSRAGYLMVGFNGGAIYRTVHRLVAKAFLGNSPVGRPFVNHKDCDKTNNRFSNLEWVTQSENTQHAVASGIQMGAFGERSGNHKLSEADVREIRASKESSIILGRRFGVSFSAICYVRRGETWRTV